jgi:signal transduction histidine kinase
VALNVRIVTIVVDSPIAERMFPGDGELARLIRGTDWSRTALGPIEAWPHSLRTAVSICLGSRHPIVLWWGPERWMFYNDGYRPMLGNAKHPQFLGRAGHECWAEIWDVIGPMMDQVLATGQATWSEDLFLLMLRSGYLEETYFTFSYSPILDDLGRPSGIFNACTETTARVLGDRRMRMLRQLVVEARTAREAVERCAEILRRNARDIPFSLFYLLDDPGEQLWLAAQTGLAAGTPASPAAVDLEPADDDGWPLARVARHGRAEIVADLDQRFASGVAHRAAALPCEPWGEPAHQAMVLPIAYAGRDQPAGVLVLGISPRRAFDDDHRGFFELVADHVATAVASARAHEEQRAHVEKLAELDRAKTAFFSNVSHEFRTPLTLILGPIEDALRDPARTLGGGELEAVHRNAVRLLRLVNSLLDFSRVEADRLQSRFEPTDLAMLTAGLAGAFQSLVDPAGLKLRVECSQLPEPAYVDRSQWEKIVLNLVSNAYKFTFAGEIAVRLCARDDRVELTVADTGTGIPVGELPRIFERFHRVSGARGRSFEGTGIGLALVRDLVHQHGGAIRVESAVDQGTTFVVTIPRGRDHLPRERVVLGDGGAAEVAAANGFVLEAKQWSGQPDAAPAAPANGSTAPANGSTAPRNESTAPRNGSTAPANRSTAPGATPGSPPTARPRPRPPAAAARILVADDNADMRRYLVRLLEQRWAVQSAEDGQAALELALRDPPDLVLSDVMMPRMDGFELLRALRANPATSTVSVMLLSARTGEEAIVGGLETGADDYLSKPFSARELLGRVGAHLEMARLRRRATEAASQLAETRAALLRDLDQKNHELETFSYSVSHDLRAPLRTIDAFSHAVLETDGDRLSDEGQASLHRVRAAAQRMSKIIDDLLQLAHLERVALRRKAVDVSAIGRRVGDRLQSADPQRSVAFEVAEQLTANADPQLVELLLENLLGNAWKFTSKTPRARIELGAIQVDGDTAFFVKDNGAGFDPAQAEQAFLPFRRLHSQEEFAGTGIGLATVRRVLDRHGGRAWVETAIGRGAAFYWTLPAPDR